MTLDEFSQLCETDFRQFGELAYHIHVEWIRQQQPTSPRYFPLGFLQDYEQLTLSQRNVARKAATFMLQVLRRVAERARV